MITNLRVVVVVVAVDPVCPDVHGVAGLLPRGAGAGRGRGRQPRLGGVRGRHQEETPLPRHRLRGRVLLSAAETAADMGGNLTFLTKLVPY